MQKIMLTLAASALATAMLTGASAADDRSATAGERANVAAVLTAGGFQSWKKIEFDRDDSTFEVDDARGTDGRIYDVDVRGGAIVKKDLED